MDIIVAVSQNMAIGKDNKLLWHIPQDLRYFKKITTGGCVIMGRKTFLSIGKALPNRRNIVISRTLNHFEGVEVASSIEDAMKLCKNEEKVFIIGGGEIYNATIGLAKRLYITFVYKEIMDADTFFPEIDFSNWRECSRESHTSENDPSLKFDFVIFERV